MAHTLNHQYVIEHTLKWTMLFKHTLKNIFFLNLEKCIYIPTLICWLYFLKGQIVLCRIKLPMHQMNCLLLYNNAYILIYVHWVGWI